MAQKFILIANNPRIADIGKKELARRVGSGKIIRFNHCENFHLFDGKTDIVALRQMRWDKYYFHGNYKNPIMRAFTWRYNYLYHKLLPDRLKERDFLSISALNIKNSCNRQSLIKNEKIIALRNKAEFWLIERSQRSHVLAIEQLNSIRFRYVMNVLNFKKKHQCTQGPSSGIFTLERLLLQHPSAEFILLGFDFYSMGQVHGSSHNLDFEQKLLCEWSKKHDITIINE